jgi:hypothetical protein
VQTSTAPLIATIAPPLPGRIHRLTLMIPP